MWELKKYTNNTAVINDRGERLTYAELQRECQALCAAAAERCLVFCLCDNKLGSLLGYVAFLNGGMVPAMLRKDLDEDLLRPLLRDYRPALVWAPAQRAGEGVLGGLVCLYRAYGYVLLKTPYGNTTVLHKDLALLLTTSGSTGSPKFVRQSYANIRANADSIVKYLHLDASERPITTLPMNYTYGLSIINSHLLVGAALLVTDKSIMQREFWSFFKSAEATSFGGVPYTYEMLDRMRFQRMNLPSLRTMTQAGGKLSPALHRKFAEDAAAAGRKFVVMYGQCEATARMGYLPPEKAVEKCGSMGVAIPGGRFRLRGENGAWITEAGVTGELIYEGPNVTMGYAERGEDLIKGDERHGRLETGDMARFDEDGYYTIVGRKKRFLKLFGNRVNLDDIERMIRARFGGADCAGAGRDDRLYLFLTEEAAVDPARRFLSEKTGLNPAAFRVLAIPEIPRNDAGKILYGELEPYMKEA